MMAEKEDTSSGRRVQLEMFFTLPDFSDISLRDYQETMQRPFFSLSKKKRLKPIEYLSPDKSVSVHVSANPEYGMATIWDADLMMYFASHLNELRERGENDLSPTIRFQPGDLLKRICWGVGGRAYDRLLQALDRLQATTIKTNIRANSKTRETTFSWIDSYTHLVDEKTQRSLGMEVTLSKWFFDGVMDQKNILAISPLYFEITSGFGKWLYRAARKHAGGNGGGGFTIGFETLYQKSGSEGSYRKFKAYIIELARVNNLPDINLEVIDAASPRPKLKMVMRRHLEQPPSKAAAKIAKGGSTGQPQATALPPPPSLPKQSDPAQEEDLVDPVEVRRLLAQASASLRTDAGNGPGNASGRHPGRSHSSRAVDILDPQTYATILAECPGWDLDVMMQTFDKFLNRNPNELPTNYSLRFLWFMRKHHERNKHTLGRF